MKDKVYHAILDYITEHGYPPTVREIGDATGIWPSMAKWHLDKLVEDGKIEVKKGAPRAIKLLEYDVELRPRVRMEEST